MTFEGMKDDDLVFCPLGGSGEIGMNMNLFGCNGQWLMVDCGMTFGDDRLPGIDLVFPDPGFIEDRRDDLVALVLTHGHEDHIGAVPYLWERLRCPIYATPFTAELVRGKLAEAGLLNEVTLHVIPVGGTLEAGCFKVTYVPLAHSIPEGHGLKIETPHGTIFHTGDWKLDDVPQIGSPTSEADLGLMGDGGILAMIGDSTNVFNSRQSGSEEGVRTALIDLVGTLEGRVVITTFASNAARLKTVAEVAQKHGRKIVLAGRSMHRIVEAARKTGYLPDWPETVPEDKASSLPRNEVLILCTGGQGEPRAALARIAAGDHRNLSLAAGDTVIFSSKIIPGNERVLGFLMNKLALLDVDVITERDADIHVSGHPGRPELERMYGWIKPQIAIPVHGEARHLKHHAAFAKSLGVPHALAPKNGDIIRLAPGPLALVDQAPAGRLVLDGKAVIAVNHEAIQARRRLMENGFVSLVILQEDDGSLLGDPEIIAQGVAGMEPGGALESDLLDEIDQALTNLSSREMLLEKTVAESARIAARRFLRIKTGKNPQVDVRVIRFDDEPL
ncbi:MULTISPECIES: ribonuclease J [unclassified Iodidimonas]|jgi:ribonuclease J|uniref:ribonuclease J n=1 Tax=unclassified Iodidimonas TaxID=2626145 RepID=UPI0024829969|nr:MULTISPECIES: ribonuclease J [unclassified Iodidimonas]